MKNLLVICGPTATGKTKLAISLSKLLSGEIISADSRQVYKGLTIGVGKEYSSDPNIPIWGYDLVDPKENFSVAQFEVYAHDKISEISGRGKLAILVGGTGLYIRAVTEGIETSTIPPNEELRNSLINKSADELYDLLLRSSPQKAKKMNESDRKNPRRLVRAIEISKSDKNVDQKSASSYKTLFIGLTAQKETLLKNIETKVLQRVKKGVETEIGNLIKSGVSWSDQSMSSLGYKQWQVYFEGKKTRDEVISDWILAEQQYVKRQLTWFRSNPRVNWFDIQDKNLIENVVQLCQSWSYNAKKN